SGNRLLQQALGFFKFALLHGAKSGLVVLHSLCKTWVFAHRLFCGCLLGHPQDLSRTLRKFSFLICLQATSQTIAAALYGFNQYRYDCRSRSPKNNLWKTSKRPRQQVIRGFAFASTRERKYTLSS